MDRTARGIDEIIQQAMQEGAFDNLPGKGKPLELDENPYLDREWQLAYHLLKQNGFAPVFIEQRQSIEMELAAAREELSRAWSWRKQAMVDGKPQDWVQGEWGRAKEMFERKIEDVNAQIKKYNLQTPVHSLFRMPISVDAEINRISH